MHAVTGRSEERLRLFAWVLLIVVYSLIVDNFPMHPCVHVALFDNDTIASEERPV